MSTSGKLTASVREEDKLMQGKLLEEKDFFMDLWGRKEKEQVEQAYLFRELIISSPLCIYSFFITELDSM